MSGPQPGGAGGNKTGEAAAKAKAWMSKAWAASRALATNKTRLEIFVEDALNDVPWGPTGAQMNEISEASFDAEKFAQVWRVVLRRLESEPAQWRRTYKALLLTEHLLKNSSQHVVQTIIDACGVIEGLKQFKYLDEKGKDQGINVSNRAKELVILLNDSERIRAERAKARSLKDKFKGVSREQMASAAAGSSPGGSYSGGYSGSRAPATSSPGGSSYYSPASAPSEPRLGAQDDYGASTHFEGMARPKGRQALPAGERGRESDEERDMHSARSSPGKGYGALPAASDDPVSATARRIESLRQAGAFLHENEGEGMGQRGGSAGNLAAAGAAAGVPTSRSYDNLAAAPSGAAQQTSKPSLHDLMARKSAGPKKLQEVRINPAIASAFVGAKLAPPPAASSSPTKPAAAAAPAPTVKLAPPPAAPNARPAPAAQPAPPSPTSLAALADMLGAPAHAQSAAAAPASPLAARSSGASSPWTAASPTSATHATEFGDFGAASAAAPFAAFPEPTPTKPGGSPTAVISLTASTAVAAHPSDAHALPAYLFAEPTPPAYGSAGSWGSRVAGAAPVPAHGAMSTGAVHKPAPVEEAADEFAEFDPFKQ
ncbi:ENTH-domain-containing [Chlorella sorokiniana]|uniref:ENTH-domain-containing n=1 Tax=Chlorella sorokiniana TaxID=3076 RepID=A0A2P6U0Q0_CHLSO|nr:ENTH-domain-containing [Chlorella sorokiniana]|eukprot:PRW59868.1 ENTH-domain-containing [Chlorella sorokiniana]